MKKKEKRSLQTEGETTKSVNTDICCKLRNCWLEENQLHTALAAVSYSSSSQTHFASAPPRLAPPSSSRTLRPVPLLPLWRPSHPCPGCSSELTSQKIKQHGKRVGRSVRELKQLAAHTSWFMLCVGVRTGGRREGEREHLSCGWAAAHCSNTYQNHEVTAPTDISSHNSGVFARSIFLMYWIRERKNTMQCQENTERKCICKSKMTWSGVLGSSDAV